MLLCLAQSAAASPEPLPRNSAPWIGQDFSSKPCQGKGQGFGPFDYTNPEHRGEPLSLVHSGHFDDKVERLEVGISGKVLPDLDYTLRAFPNHHRALWALIRYYLEKRPYDDNIPKPECYLQRAINFKKGDGNVWMLFGNYLYKLGKKEQALQYYDNALKIMPQSAELHYNMGLLYTDMGRYQEAVSHAKQAYALGYPLPGLRNKLKREGQWR